MFCLAETVRTVLHCLCTSVAFDFCQKSVTHIFGPNHGLYFVLLMYMFIIMQMCLVTVPLGCFGINVISPFLLKMFWLFLKKCSVLVDCPFSGPLTRENRLLYFLFIKIDLKHG